MAKQGVTLDTVMIKVESNAGKSTSSIDKLSSSLTNLKSAISGGFGQLKNLGEYLQNLSKGMTSLNKIKIDTEQFKILSNSLTMLSSIKNPTGLNNIAKNLNKLPTAFNNFDTTSLQNIERVSTSLATALTPLAEKLGEISQGFADVARWADKYGISITKVYSYNKQTSSGIKDLKTMFKNLTSTVKQSKQIMSNFTKNATKGFDSLKSKIKQVALSLIGTRTAFTMIRKAVSEYMALDEQLTKYTTNVWRAFGAQLAPAIEYAMYLFKQFVRVIYSVILALTGIDLISRANQKTMEGYGKSVKDTLANLQKFDDLNVAEFPSSSSGDLDDKLIDLQTIDLTPIQWLIDLVKELKEAIIDAFDSGRWYGVGEVIGEIINESLAHIPWEDMKSTLANVAGYFADGLNGAIESVSWDRVGDFLTQSATTFYDTINVLLTQIHWDSIGTGLTSFLEGLDLEAMITSKLNIFSTLATGLGEMLESFDASLLGEKITEGLLAVTDSFDTIINSIPWSLLGEKIRETILSIDWTEIWNHVVTLFEDSFKGLDTFFDSLFGFEGGGELVGTLTTALGLSKLMSGVDLSKPFEKLGKNKKLIDTNLIKPIGEFMGKLTSSGGLTEMLTGIGNTISTAFGGASLGTIGLIAAAIGLVVIAIKQLWEENEGFRETVTELFNGILQTFQTVWENIQPSLESLMKSLKEIWHDVLEPLIQLLVDQLKPIIQTVINILKVLWDNVISPLAEVLSVVFAGAVEYLSGYLSFLAKVVGTVIDVLQWLWKNIAEPIVDFITDVFIAVIKLVTTQVKTNIEIIKRVIQIIVDFVKSAWKTVSNIVGAIANWIYDHMIKPIIEKFQTLKKTIGEIWDGIWSTIKGVINKILGGMENFLNGIIRAINKVIRKVDNINDFFEWLGFEIEIKELSEISIPKLETGTNRIPQEGLYHLHPDEAVVPKKYNPAVGGSSYGEETNQKLDKLISVMENLNTTTIVNLGNKTLYKEQQSYNSFQNNKYGTINL
jgi:septation ring formation regulator EzrA